MNGQPIAVRKIDAHTVVLTLPAPFGPGLRLLNALPILPAHKLRDALAKGEFAKAWSTATPPADIVGLGPYVLRGYTPGERVELARNPRYGARGPGVQPEVERLTLRIIPSQDAERLALEAGELDIMNADVRPDDLKAVRAPRGGRQGAPLRHRAGRRPGRALVQPRPRRPQAGRRPARGSIARCAGPSRTPSTAPPSSTRSISAPAVQADGPVPPGNRVWHSDKLPRYAYDLAARATLLDRRRAEGRQRRRHLRDARPASR